MPIVLQTAAGRWRPLHPRDMAVHLASLQVPWWVAGGWALDLFVGAQIRPHDDLDVGVFRRDVPEILAALSSWEVFEAKDGSLTRLGDGGVPDAAVNSLWCRPANEMDWSFELMLDECEEDRWVFRRDRSIQRPLALAVRRDPAGIPFLAPEIQLLYKARAVRPKDRTDFDRVGSQLDPDARTWLRTALTKLDPQHEWLVASPHLAGKEPGKQKPGFT